MQTRGGWWVARYTEYRQYVCKSFCLDIYRRATIECIHRRRGSLGWSAQLRPNEAREGGASCSSNTTCLLLLFLSPFSLSSLRYQHWLAGCLLLALAAQHSRHRSVRVPRKNKTKGLPYLSSCPFPLIHTSAGLQIGRLLLDTYASLFEGRD